MPLGTAGSLVGRVWANAGALTVPTITAGQPFDGVRTDWVTYILDSTVGMLHVTFDGINDLGLVILSGTKLLARVPPHALGLVDIIPINTVGAGPTVVNGFEYTDFTAKLGRRRCRLGNIRLGVGT